MEKIYSRKRIQVPHIRFNQFPRGKANIKKRKLYEMILIITIAIFAMVMIINAINPIIDKICIDESRNKATLISNKKATEVMENYTYEDLMTIHRDNENNENNVSMLEANIIVINSLTSDIAVKIQEEINRDSKSMVHIKLRKFNRY